MNSRITIFSIIVLVFAPAVYYFLNIANQEEAHYFREMTITAIAETDGRVTVPTESEDKLGATLNAVFKPALIEKVAGIKSPNPNGLEITVDSVTSAIANCTQQGKIPLKAVFNVASNCAAADFASWKAEKKTSLFVDPTENLIVFGDSGNNYARVYHNNMIATYFSPDMVQSDRRREACIVRAMLDFLVGKKPDPDASCALSP